MTDTSSLFPEEPTNLTAGRRSRPQAPARVPMPDRSPVVVRTSSLDSLLALAHRVRMVWGYVERQNMKGLYAEINAVESWVGRPAIAPEIRYALWLYATLKGVGNAWALALLTQTHDAYRWIFCGGVSVNYPAVADFRSGETDALDELLAEGIASLMAAGAVKLKAVAQDGVRVRASAGAASFRRGKKLLGYLQVARQRVAKLKVQVHHDPAGGTRREQSAQLRAATEREARIAAALARQPELAALNELPGKAPEDARSSTTDADATVMKIGDGGFRPAFNFQFATDTES